MSRLWNLFKSRHLNDSVSNEELAKHNVSVACLSTLEERVHVNVATKTRKTTYSECDRAALSVRFHF